METVTMARCIAVFGVALLVACGGKPAPPDLHGTWRAVLTGGAGDLPFGLEVTAEDGRDVAYLVNGPERVRVTDVTVEGERILLGMPGYPHRIEATLEDGQLRGAVVFVRPGGETGSVRLVADRGAGWRFFPVPDASPLDFGGRWALTFRDPESGRESAAVAELSQDGHVVNGTVLRESGDDRYLAGEVRGDTLFLSRFDGGSARLYVLRQEADGSVSGRVGPYELSGRRDPEAALRDGATLTTLRADHEPLDFELPDVDGRPVSIRDERFRDKVVIVTIGGTWCPNCHDEAVFLRDFLPPRRERGLEVVQLMFEYEDDFDAAAAGVRDFIDKFGIDYPVLVAGSYGPGRVQQVLPQIETFFAYPTTLVLDREGRIRHTHTGFSGPATGSHYEEFERKFAALIDDLLAEG